MSGIPPPAPILPGDAPLELARLADTVGDEPEVIAQFLRYFLPMANKVGGALLAAVGEGRLADAANLAHQLKSPAHSVGANRLGALCEQLEAAGQRLDADGCAALRAPLAAELQAVEDAIGRHLDPAP